MERTWRNEAAALCLAPLVATLPLIPISSFPSSPLFLGKLMDNPAHPMNWPHLGPWISALAVVFDGQILGFLVTLFLVLPVYAGLRENGRNSARNILMVCAGAGLIASQIARFIAQGFQQRDLRAFANSWQSPVVGCLCGLVAGAFIAYFGKRRIALPICSAPVAVMVVSASVIMWSAGVAHHH
jgi:hypothetical protein